MDIVIRNGVIDNEESKRIREIKNEAGLLKKDYKDYIRGIPGPYYDLLNSHICIPRRANVIKNFYGPQDPKKIKLLENTHLINHNDTYCVICHKLLKQNTAFSVKKRILVDEDIFMKKPNKSDLMIESMKKLKIETKNKLYEDKLDNELSNKIEKINISNLRIIKWHKLYNNFYKYNITKTLNNKIFHRKKIINKFYILCYKLITPQIHYDISIFQTKLIYPNELTPYQRFKLNNPNYKNEPIFNHQKNHRITEKFITIE